MPPTGRLSRDRGEPPNARPGRRARGRPRKAPADQPYRPPHPGGLGRDGRVACTDQADPARVPDRRGPPALGGGLRRLLVPARPCHHLQHARRHGRGARGGPRDLRGEAPRRRRFLVRGSSHRRRGPGGGPGGARLRTGRLGARLGRHGAGADVCVRRREHALQLHLDDVARRRSRDLRSRVAGRRGNPLRRRCGDGARPRRRPRHRARDPARQGDALADRGAVRSAPLRRRAAPPHPGPVAPLAAHRHPARAGVDGAGGGDAHPDLCARQFRVHRGPGLVLGRPAPGRRGARARDDDRLRAAAQPDAAVRDRPPDGPGRSSSAR